MEPAWPVGRLCWASTEKLQVGVAMPEAGEERSPPPLLTVGKGQRVVLGAILPLADTVYELSQPQKRVAEGFSVGFAGGSLQSKHIRGFALDST